MPPLMRIRAPAAFVHPCTAKLKGGCPPFNFKPCVGTLNYSWALFTILGTTSCGCLVLPNVVGGAEVKYVETL